MSKRRAPRGCSDFAAALPQGSIRAWARAATGYPAARPSGSAIARAFLKNAPLLLLDEPTAHLDPATEAEVLDSLRRLALGRTVILASHSAAAPPSGDGGSTSRRPRCAARGGVSAMPNPRLVARPRRGWLALGDAHLAGASAAGVALMAVAGTMVSGGRCSPARWSLPSLLRGLGVGRVVLRYVER